MKNLKVNVSEDLGIFKLLKGNRPPNPHHVKRLASSIEKFGMLANPILVNEDYEIIDGQHRYLAAKETGSPVYYIIAEGYALEQVHALNMNQKNWTAIEFLNGYADMGIEDYVILKKFLKRHSWLRVNDAVAICSNVTSSHINEANYTNNINSTRLFKEGTWKARDMVLAEINANKIKSIEPYFDAYDTSAFIQTMLWMFKHSNYNHDTFLQKLKLQPSALVRCASRSQYKILIEEIYNYRNRNKVNLRF